MIKTLKALSLSKPVALIVSTAIAFSISTANADEVTNIAPTTYSGAAVVKMDDNHYRVRITSLLAAKMRCVAYNNEEPIAINSVAIYPPEGVADFYISPEEGPVTHSTCWVTSTRDGDREKIEQLENESQQRQMKIEESNVPFYQIMPNTQ
ncbi:hypothetical protein L4C54_10355 [Vibrio lamellibrachiae]|uniref:hypothetical protein n=1 Tax=Vibrio lamellibrachiae TaxID=2910253 RepID=UPI003D12D73F